MSEKENEQQITSGIGITILSHGQPFWIKPKGMGHGWLRATYVTGGKFKLENEDKIYTFQELDDYRKR